MRSRISSILIGAAIAAAITLPAKAGNAAWVNGPWRPYDARTLKMDGIVATVKVDVKESGPMVLQISGLQDRVSGLQVNSAGGTLSIRSNSVDGVWDWHNWFNFSQDLTPQSSQLVIHVAVPRGSAVKVDGLVGNATIGDTQGSLAFDASGYTESHIGNVADAHLSLAGSGKVWVGNVAGLVSAETAGSGDIKIGNARRMKADIAGSGSVAAGWINGPIDVDIAGSGDFTAAGVNGPVKASIAGSGSVTIAGGEANPLHVDIMGSGNVTFGGTAVDPRISAMGSGSVRLKAYRGTLSNDGMANLKIGG
ncbi:MAG: DUF2807 domain-containing protein [Alphaproteobacteria bacterium]|nr:DUF2807 domain-containing protein [Alphaproteobacteria bacterium]